VFEPSTYGSEGLKNLDRDSEPRCTLNWSLVRFLAVVSWGWMGSRVVMLASTGVTRESQHLIGHPYKTHQSKQLNSHLDDAAAALAFIARRI